MHEPIAVDSVDGSLDGIGVSEQIYLNVRRAIITEQIPAGTRLTEARLATALQVSRVPLREALPRLEADGFIVTAPNRSPVVTGWSTTRVLDTFDARLAIEPDAVRLATIAVSTGASTERVEAAIADADRLLEGSSALELAERHAHIYYLLVNTAGSALLTTFMRTLSHHLTWLFYLSPLPQPRRAYQELTEVVDAIRNGEGGLAKASMIRHIASRRDAALETIDAVTSEIPQSWGNPKPPRRRREG